MRSDEGGRQKLLMKVFSGSLTMRREWKMIRMLRDYVRECPGSCSMGRRRKRWIDTVKESLRKRGLNVREARTMVQDRSERQRFMKGSVWGVARRMNP